MGYFPLRTPVAPCNEHPVECDEALSRHVTIRDNDTASECYTGDTPGLSRSGPTLVNKRQVTPSVTGGRNLRRNKTINDNNLYNNKVVPEPF